MAEYVWFLQRLRQDLGKSYTVAEEHTIDPGQVNVLVRRQRHDETLAVATDTRWLAELARDPSATAPAEYKRLTVLISAFFANPAALPSRTFHWPGSPESREELRYTLISRRHLNTV